MGTLPENDALRDLATLRIAKELFTSDWYAHSAGFLFEGAEARELLRIAQETRHEREGVDEVVRAWAKESTSDAAEGAMSGVAARVRRITRVEFLRELILSKDAAAEGLEKAALMAPPPHRERLLELAATDFRHANTLRGMLTREFDDYAAEPEADR